MIYADFDFYKNTFLGVEIGEDDFPRMARRASEEIDHIARQQAEAYFALDPAPISNAVCAVAEILQRAERSNSMMGGGGAIHSETTKSHSITYADPVNAATEAGQAAIAAEIKRAINRYLSHTGLLYRGVAMC